LQGYLNAKGSSDKKTLHMIKDMGFTINADVPLETLLDKSETDSTMYALKGLKELRPFQEGK
jgi:hypothetical protein